MLCDARHPGELCRPCFAGYVAREIEGGKLHIKCPSCPRSLQMREVRHVVEPALYDTLVERVKTAEVRGSRPLEMALRDSGAGPR